MYGAGAWGGGTDRQNKQKNDQYGRALSRQGTTQKTHQYLELTSKETGQQKGGD